MEEQFQEFITALREAGLSISLAESLDCLRAMSLVPWDERGVFQAALRTTLVKRSPDIPAFERLFELYFGLHPRPALPPADEDGRLEARLAAEWESLAGQPGVVAMAGLLVTGQRGEWQRLIRQAAEQVGLAEIRYAAQARPYARLILDRFDWQAIQQTLALLAQQLENGGLTLQEMAQVRQRIEANVRAFGEMVREMVNRQVERQAVARAVQGEEDRLLSKPFSALSQEEMAAMRQAVDRLARQLKDRLGRQPRPAQRGRLDLKTLLRRNLQYGGLPVELAWRKKRRVKPDIISLCDISSSVWHAARFMLQFLYTVQEQCSRVRSFVFVADLEEVTALFERHDLEQAIDLAFRRDYYERSDYGGVLTGFCQRYLDAVNNRTTILIIGDARNNWLPAHTGALQAIQERARRIVWLNPEMTGQWGSGDSIMPLYRPYCTVATECRNLQQLGRIVEGLFYG